MDLLYINAMDIENLNLTNEEILGAVEKSLEAQGNGKTVIEPRVHLIDLTGAFSKNPVHPGLILIHKTVFHKYFNGTCKTTAVYT